MTSPTEQRRAFDAAMDSYRSGDRATALGIFTRVTADNPAMSDAWLGRLACGDQELDTLAGAHENSRRSTAKPAASVSRPANCTP